MTTTIPPLDPRSTSVECLRDWLAGQALVALLSGRDEGCTFTTEEAATKSYAIAQAMLVERQKYEAQ